MVVYWWGQKKGELLKKLIFEAAREHHANSGGLWMSWGIGARVSGHEESESRWWNGKGVPESKWKKDNKGKRTQKEVGKASEKEIFKRM